MNKLMKLSMVAALTLGLVACAKTEGSEEKGIKIGMVTDSGTIDDKSFNQGTWEVCWSTKKIIQAQRFSI